MLARDPAEHGGQRLRVGGEEADPVRDDVRVVDAEVVRTVVRHGEHRGDLLAFLVASGNDDDRHGAGRAQRADHVLAVDIGQPEIENDEIGLPGPIERLLPGRRLRFGGSTSKSGLRQAVGSSLYRHTQLSIVRTDPNGAKLSMLF